MIASVAQGEVVYGAVRALHCRRTSCRGACLPCFVVPSPSTNGAPSADAEPRRCSAPELTAIERRSRTERSHESLQRGIEHSRPRPQDK